MHQASGRGERESIRWKEEGRKKREKERERSRADAASKQNKCIWSC